MLKKIKILLIYLREIDSTDTYRSIKNPSSGLYKEKGSKFLAFAIPVLTVKKAKKEIRNLRDLHPKAVHVCYSWRLGINNFEDRYSDDGEPNNSAGKPIFGQILSAELSNILIAVVRYYGGTKLGVGGLVQAYKAAAKAALDNATIIEKYETTSFQINFDPARTGVLMSILNGLSADIKNHGFEGTLHSIEIEIRNSSEQEIIDIFEKSPNFELIKLND